MRKVAVALAAVLLASAVAPTAGAAPSRADEARRHVHDPDRDDRYELVATPEDVRETRSLVTDAARPEIGEERIWLASDDVEFTLYPKEYTLRGVGEHIEVWVASDRDRVSSDLNFPEGDCRNDGVRNVITDEQVNYLIEQFDTVIYPTESEAFSVPPPRDGANAPLTEELGLPTAYYRGPGDRVVALVDNVRDENFYDPEFPVYTAGFYSSTLDFLFNRLVMTIDSYDWLHLTGPNPPDEPSEDPCLSSPAGPFWYEIVFAHEYQHLLQQYVRGFETTWLDEGLADHAAVITGYLDPSAPVTHPRHDTGVQCFLGHGIVITPENQNPDRGGPENSLTLWGDQTDYEEEILCDYGAALAFMEYLSGQFGPDFMSALHRDPEAGLDSLAGLLAGEAGSPTIGIVIQRWATMLAVDQALDAGWSLVGADPATLSTPTMNADVNWDNDQAYAGPGAPPNGSDYVRIRDDAGSYLNVGEVTSIEFDGESELRPLPLEWRVDRRPPGGGTGAALYSGRGDNLDRGLARVVRVGRDGRLEFDAAWHTETGYDYAYVQVSDDGGRTYRSVRCTDSIDAPLGPGFEGRSNGFVHQRCNLGRWSGEPVIVSFRYVTDAAVIRDGFWIDNLEVGGDLVSTGGALRGWDSPTQINPIDVQTLAVRLVAFDNGDNVVHVARLPLDRDFDGSLSGAELADAVGTNGAKIAAIVTHVDRTETVLQPALYTLTVDGVVQPGGGA